VAKKVARSGKLRHLPRLIGKSGKQSGKKVASKVAKFTTCIYRHLHGMDQGRIQRVGHVQKWQKGGKK